MKLIIANLLLSLFLVPILLCQEQKDNKLGSIGTIRLIISLNSFHNVTAEDAKVLAHILANHIIKDHNLRNEFNVITPESTSDIEKAAGNDFNIIIITTEEYLSLYKKLALEPFVTNYSAGHIGYKYHFVVSKSNGIIDISELRNESIINLSRPNQRAVFFRLDKLLKHNKLLNQQNFFKSFTTDYKATNFLLPVFFNKTKACIVTEISLNLFSELNPAIKNETIIIDSSNYLILGLSNMNSKIKDTEVYHLLKEIIPSNHTNEYGNQLVKLFNVDQLIPFKDEYLQNYLNLAK